MARSVYASLVVLGMLGGVAVAGGDTAWDGTYSREGAGGNELCPDVDSVTVTHQAFSIVWTIRYANARQFRVGHIDGTISAAGTVKVNATVFSPLAADTVAKLEEMGDKLDDVKKVAAEMKIHIQAKPKRRISLASGICYASWDGGEAIANDEAKPPKKPARTAPAKTPPATVASSKPPASTAKPTTSSPSKLSAPTTSAARPAESKHSEPKPAPKPKLNLQPGAQCNEDDDCESSKCTFGQCYGRHGKPEFLSGSKCMHDQDCASGTCHDTCR